MKMSFVDSFMRKNESVSIISHKINSDVKSHMQDFIEIIFITSGKCTHSINGTKSVLKPGTFVIVGNEYSHSITPDGYIEYYNILIRPELLLNDSGNSSSVVDSVFITMYEEFRKNERTSHKITNFKDYELTLFEGYIKSMYREYTEKQPGYEKVTESLLYIILTHVMRKMMSGEQEILENSKLSNVLEYINDHYNKKISARELAEKSFYNPSYFSRMFKETIGKTPLEYITGLRIEKACSQLADTGKRIEEIARDVGYNNTAKFHAAFKKKKGVTPLTYRKENPKNI